MECNWQTKHCIIRMTQWSQSIRLIVCFAVLTCTIFATALQAHHDEPGSYREFELKEERFEIEVNITELFYQLTYVPVSVRARVYQEIEDLQQRWNRVIQELIEIDRAEHPTQPTRP